MKKAAEDIAKERNASLTLIDAPAGIGCPVIASLTGTDYILAVTEPTPSALHDLKRVLYLANHFKIKHGIVINKFDIERKFCSKIEIFAKKSKIPILGKIPYKKDFIKSSVSITDKYPKYRKIFDKIMKGIES